VRAYTRKLIKWYTLSLFTFWHWGQPFFILNARATKSPLNVNDSVIFAQLSASWKSNLLHIQAEGS
jgi:hypothetical protein